MSASDPVTGIAGVIEEGIKDIAAPLIADASAQKYETRFKQRLSDLNAAFLENDPSKRADSLAFVFNELCLAAGVPAQGGMGEVISVPVDYLRSLGTIAAQQERSSAYLAALTAKATK